MLGLTVVVVWFALVTVFLVRQWWVSELAQAREGVPAPASAALPVAQPVAALRPAEALGGGASAGRSAGVPRRLDAGTTGGTVPSFRWSTAHAAGSAAR
jgi:hypothetical protein